MDNKLKQRLRALGDVDKVRVNENKLSSLIYRKNSIKGETFGIINESGKYFIKKSNKLNSEDSKDFEYIGGLKNRLQESYGSYNSALHRLNEKIKLINESAKEEFIEDKKEEKSNEKETTSEVKNTILEKLLSKVEKNEGKDCDFYKDLESETKSMLKKETLSKDDIDDIKNILDDHDCLDEYGYLLKKKVKPETEKKEKDDISKEDESLSEEKLTKDSREQKLLNKLDKENKDNNKAVTPPAPEPLPAPELDDAPIDTNEPQFGNEKNAPEGEENSDEDEMEGEENSDEESSDEDDTESDDPANEALKLMGKLVKNLNKLEGADKETAKNLFGQLITATKNSIADMDDDEKGKIIKRIEKNGDKIEEGKNYTMPRMSINEKTKKLVKRIVSEEVNKFKNKI